jgi:alpha-methylacyl-CoA racemase
MTGWGQEGPYAGTAGHDITYAATAGVLHAIGPADGPPQVPLNLVGDFAGALYLTTGLLAALHEARESGRGQVVDAAMVDSSAHLMTAFHGLLAEGVWRDERGSNLLDGGAPFYGVYATSDGGWMAVGALEPQFYDHLVDRLGIPPGDADRTDPAADRGPQPRAPRQPRHVHRARRGRAAGSRATLLPHTGRARPATTGPR